MIVAHETRELDGMRGGVVVPTMGALHEGHAALVRRAREVAVRGRVGAPVVVTVFVNPTQFGEAADFERYPRTLEADAAVCAAAGADAVFAPARETVYPAGVEVRVPALPAVATRPGLEDAHRPGHFAGVCQVVLRLFELTRPSVAVFGEKDWQQLQVVRAMVRAEGLGVAIEPVPTVREADGLAMSSRNRFLSREDRARAAAIPEALRAGARCTSASEAEAAMRGVLARAAIEPDYCTIREGETLEPVRGDGPGRRALIAARVGTVRLLDNAPWGA